MVKERYNPKPIKINPIQAEFSDHHLTNYAGLVPVAEFLFRKLDFIKALSDHLFLPIRSNITFHNFQLLGLIIFGYLGGSTRLSHFEELSKDRIIQRLLGLVKPVDENTLGRRIKKFTFKSAHQFSTVTGYLQRKVHRQYSFSSARPQIVDFDSSVRGVYGSPEGAARGFNPKCRGQKSYHPLLAFFTKTKECLHTWYRPGNTYTGNGAAEFFKECVLRLPGSDFSWLFRADSGFFQNDLLSAIEEYQASYLVKVKLRNLNHLLSKQTWQSIPSLTNTEYCEFEHQCQGWTAPRKFVGIRILKEIITEGCLFPQYIYDYHCFVTNLEEAPLEIYHLYKDRAECENWIEAVKNQIGAGKSTTIRILLSLIKPTMGEFSFFGQDFRKTDRNVYAKIGALVEKPDFYLFLSARRNLQMLAGLSGGVPAKRIDEVLEIVKLADRADDRVKSYSHGMKQRLGIAQSILNHPEIIILDEPTNGLDPEGIKEIRELILRLAGDFGITIFLSSHLLHEIEQTCSHVAIIDTGKLVVQGNVHDLLRKTDFYITEVQVNNPQRAASLLENETWIQKVTLGNDVLKIQIPAENRPRLTRFLVENEFAVSSIIPRTSLEDYYLTLLNRDVK